MQALVAFHARPSDPIFIEKRSLQDWFSMGRKYAFFRSMDSLHSYFSLAWPGMRHGNQRTLINALTHHPSKERIMWLSSIPNVSFYLRSLPECFESLCTLLLGWLSIQVCLPQGNCVNGKQIRPHSLKRVSPAAMLWFQVSPTHHFPTSHPSTLQSLRARSVSAEEKPINARPGLSSMLSFEKVIWCLSNRVYCSQEKWSPCLPAFTLSLWSRVQAGNLHPPQFCTHLI